MYNTFEVLNSIHELNIHKTASCFSKQKLTKITVVFDAEKTSYTLGIILYNFSFPERFDFQLNLAHLV